MTLADLSDAQLLESLHSLYGQGRAVLARLLAHLVEVEERRLHLEAASPSMFHFCVHKLGMSEDEACRRIHVARLARRFPDLLVRIERGDLTLSTIALLHGTLSEATYEELVEAAAGKTKAEVQTLLAKRTPKPDVPSAITPLSETRHKVQFTASDELRRKLERAQDLMRHANPEGDLAIVVDHAVDLLLEKLEKRRLGKTSLPSASRERSDTEQPSDTAPVSSATRRAVFERDGERCSFTDVEGHRCTATTWLELDHGAPGEVWSERRAIAA